MIDGVPIVREAFPHTIRLVATARLRAAVLSELAGEDDLAALAEIEGATGRRLIAETRGLAGLYANELVHGIPHAHFINASFAYAKPHALNRFTGPTGGAWYAALDVETSLAEVAYHLGRALADAGDFNAVVDYGEMHASMAGQFLDLRGQPKHRSLDPDESVGDPAGIALAAAAKSAGLNGIIYPSVRHAGGTCLAALWPHAVQSVAQGDVWRLSWKGRPEPDVSRVGSL